MIARLGVHNSRLAEIRNQIFKIRVASIRTSKSLTGAFGKGGVERRGSAFDFSFGHDVAINGGKSISCIMVYGFSEKFLTKCSTAFSVELFEFSTRDSPSEI